jgi:N-acyl-L-homoserine lactone synthetase
MTVFQELANDLGCPENPELNESSKYLINT